MEWYLDDVASLDTENHWLGHRLPPALVSVVDSFLYHRCRGTYTLLTLRNDDVVWQLEHVPLCLLQALEVQPAIAQRPYMDALVHLIDRHDMDDLFEWDDALSVTGGYSLLICMNRLGRCDETFLAKMRILCSFRTIMAISQLVTQEPVTPLTAEILTSFLVDDATNVIDEALDNNVIVRLVIATIDALVVLAPEKVPDFMTHWVCTVNSLDANRRKLYPIVRALAQKFALVPLYAKMTVLLATLCRTVFTASGIRPELLPTVVADFVLGDVPLDPTHCSQCMDAAIFLKNGVAIQFQRNTRICADIRALANAHADRLTLQCSDWSDAYELRKVPGQATEAERIQYIRAHGDQAHDITCVATLDTLLAALTARERGDQTCTSRPHKRRRSDGA
ncbi:hypothetical protein SPRG_17358 [Saprolegnia parasitica CBS 223.65]|uniref:Uncharacterized protein n=1 Tax=Saprolegnia parasitica (strain CBS 223.65) TaxID=695850 RepID=A0A067BFI0_SAPPC|nr:hypothetical protein SPRG_17358 [Saprolegnia parasitica CBS 223.65]KDO17134.1 hypothetical protein SPRG_17358 [Saprolegnia parasitica CBS 223.65]|eukprot:XP_012212160.1 hypothetical protein SPRG_17358 [Saprolegnia parasitica CBS 223.65]